VGTVGCPRSYSIQLGKELRPRIVRKALMRQACECLKTFSSEFQAVGKPNQANGQFRDEIIRHGSVYLE
jgi:hypothetical protein